jgi:orotate phosphoribosyltransferase
VETELIASLAARTGHFALESGHHGELWLDLDAWFVQPRPIARFAAELARRLAPFGCDVVCGPLIGGALVAQLVAIALDIELSYARPGDRAGAGLYTARYEIPPALRDKLAGKRVAIVDDVVNAGSAIRATRADLQRCGAEVVAIGALLVLGTATAELGLPVASVAALPNRIWAPADCPLCTSGVALDDPFIRAVATP